MPLFAAGVSHHHVASDAVGQLAHRADEVAARLLASSDVVAGVAVLATCNRFEIYLDVAGFHSAVETTLAAVRDTVAELDPEVLDAFVVYAGQGVVEHLFEVACGLDSMVVGEAEVAGQVRSALSRADATASPPLRRLFQDALTTSKAVTSRTGLSSAGRSIASVGLDIAGERLGSWADARVLLIGTGAYARVVVADLARRGCTDILVYSPTGQAERFAATHPVEPVSASGLVDALTRADAVIACSGHGPAVLTADLVAEARRGREPVLAVVDLSAASDVAVEVEALAEVDVITLDRIGDQVPSEQGDAVLDARDIVRRAVATYLHLEEGRMAVPAVTAIRAHVSQIIEREIELAQDHHSPEVAAAIARSLRRVSNSLLHAPSVRAAELARSGELDDYRRALHTLFGIVVEAGQ